jgi:hypothetical protein
MQKEEEVSHPKVKYTGKLKPGKRSGLRAMYNMYVQIANLELGSRL